MKRRWWFVAAGVVAAAIAVGAGTLVMAQQSNQTGGTTFLDRVAQKLGIDTPKLQDAVKSAANDEIDAAVQRGDITQQQADKLKQQVANGNFPGFNGPLVKGGKGRGLEGSAFAFGFLAGADRQKLADFFGITVDQLKTELQAQGATLASVAQAHGKSRDDLKNFITDQAKTRLDQAVANKKITQQQEDNILNALNSRLDQLIDASPPRFKGKFGPGMRGMPGMVAPMTPPAPTATPGSGTEFEMPGRFRGNSGTASMTYTY